VVGGRILEEKVEYKILKTVSITQNFNFKWYLEDDIKYFELTETYVSCCGDKISNIKNVKKERLFSYSFEYDNHRIYLMCQ